MLIWFSNSYWSIAGALIQINPMQGDYCADRFDIDEISVMDMAQEPSFKPTTRALFLQQQVTAGSPASNQVSFVQISKP